MRQFGVAWNRPGCSGDRLPRQYRKSIPPVPVPPEDAKDWTLVLPSSNQSLQFQYSTVLTERSKWTKKRRQPPDPDDAAAEGVCLQPACKASLFVGPKMISSPTVSALSAPPVAAGVLYRLRSLLTRPIRLERRGLDWHFVFDSKPRKTGTRRAGEASPRRRSPAELPSMTPREVTEVCANLREMLGGEVGHHPRLPSLALLERALVKNGERGVDEVPAAVLRHAAQALDAFDLDRYGPGLVLLRRRIEQVLRRRHGDRPSHAASQPDQPTERLAAAMAPGALKDFSDSLTEFISIDRMFGDRRA